MTAQILPAPLSAFQKIASGHLPIDAAGGEMSFAAVLEQRMDPGGEDESRRGPGKGWLRLAAMIDPLATVDGDAEEAAERQAAPMAIPFVDAGVFGRFVAADATRDASCVALPPSIGQEGSPAWFMTGAPLPNDNEAHGREPRSAAMADPLPLPIASSSAARSASVSVASRPGVAAAWPSPATAALLPVSEPAGEIRTTEIVGGSSAHRPERPDRRAAAMIQYAPINVTLQWNSNGLQLILRMASASGVDEAELERATLQAIARDGGDFSTLTLNGRRVARLSRR